MRLYNFMQNEVFEKRKDMMKGAVGFVLIVLFVYTGFRYVGLENLQDQIEKAGVFGPIVFILLKASTIVIAPLNGAVFYLISAPLFGLGLGIIYSWAGDLIGAVIAFWISRTFGIRIVKRFLSAKMLKNLDSVLWYVGNWKRLALARLALSSVTEVVSYGAGLSAISFNQYFWVTLIWEGISVLPYVLLGTQISRVSPVFMTLIAIGAMFIGLAGLALLRRLEKNRAGEKR